MNRHFTEEELTLYYYGEARRREDIDAHLGRCTAGATTYKGIAATLAMLATPDAPARGEQYGLEVWQRIRHKLPEQNAPWWTPWIRSDRLGWAAVAATIVVAAFVAGRVWERRPAAPAVPGAAAATRSAPAAAVPHRSRRASLADHLS